MFTPTLQNHHQPLGLCSLYIVCTACFVLSFAQSEHPQSPHPPQSVTGAAAALDLPQAPCGAGGAQGLGANPLSSCCISASCSFFCDASILSSSLDRMSKAFSNCITPCVHWVGTVERDCFHRPRVSHPPHTTFPLRSF